MAENLKRLTISAPAAGYDRFSLSFDGDTITLTGHEVPKGLSPTAVIEFIAVRGFEYLDERTNSSHISDTYDCLVEINSSELMLRTINNYSGDLKESNSYHLFLKNFGSIGVICRLVRIYGLKN